MGQSPHDRRGNGSSPPVRRAYCPAGSVAPQRRRLRRENGTGYPLGALAPPRPGKSQAAVSPPRFPSSFSPPAAFLRHPAWRGAGRRAARLLPHLPNLRRARTMRVRWPPKVNLVGTKSREPNKQWPLGQGLRESAAAGGPARPRLVSIRFVVSAPPRSGLSRPPGGATRPMRPRSILRDRDNARRVQEGGRQKRGH